MIIYELIWPMLAMVLIFMNIFQLIYWSRETHKLIDKLMSRNYADYVVSSRPPAPDLPLGPLDQEIVPDNQLEQLNGIMQGL